MWHFWNVAHFRKFFKIDPLIYRSKNKINLLWKLIVRCLKIIPPLPTSQKKWFRIYKIPVESYRKRWIFQSWPKVFWSPLQGSPNCPPRRIERRTRPTLKTVIDLKLSFFYSIVLSLYPNQAIYFEKCDQGWQVDNKKF